MKQPLAMLAFWIFACSAGGNVANSRTMLPPAIFASGWLECLSSDWLSFNTAALTNRFFGRSGRREDIWKTSVSCIRHSKRNTWVKFDNLCETSLRQHVNEVHYRFILICLRLNEPRRNIGFHLTVITLKALSYLDTNFWSLFNAVYANNVPK